MKGVSPLISMKSSVVAILRFMSGDGMQPWPWYIYAAKLHLPILRISAIVCVDQALGLVLVNSVGDCFAQITALSVPVGS